MKKSYILLVCVFTFLLLRGSVFALEIRSLEGRRINPVIISPLDDEIQNPSDAPNATPSHTPIQGPRTSNSPTPQIPTPTVSVVPISSPFPSKIIQLFISKLPRDIRLNPTQAVTQNSNQTQNAEVSSLNQEKIWKLQCIDTMKASRDMARQWKHRSDLQQYVSWTISTIKSMGANCVGIGTPYDEEFIPFLRVWVNEAHNQGLRVWFRGNFSGWEEWFGYGRLSSLQEHHDKIANFIKSNSGLFQNSDIFTPVPEPENGFIGNPFVTGKTAEFRNFLVTSYQNCVRAISSIGRSTTCGYFSTNGDVARDIIDKDTLQKIGNVLVVDHYVRDPQILGNDIATLSQKYDTRIMLGEFGAPIPDLNGSQNQSQQESFVRSLLINSFKNRQIMEGLNYFVLTFGSTALLNNDGSNRLVVEAIKDFYLPGKISGKLVDSTNKPLSNIEVKISGGLATVTTDEKGEFNTILPVGNHSISINDPKYQAYENAASLGRSEQKSFTITIDPLEKDFSFRVRELIGRIIR